MRYLHTMVRVKDLDASLTFYTTLFGLEEICRHENEKGRFTLVFLAARDDLDRARSEKAPASSLPTIGTRKIIAEDAISATSLMRSTIFTRPARI